MCTSPCATYWCTASSAHTKTNPPLHCSPNLRSLLKLRLTQSQKLIIQMWIICCNVTPLASLYEWSLTLYLLHKGLSRLPKVCISFETDCTVTKTAGECPRYHSSAVKTKLKQEKHLITWYLCQCVLCLFFRRSISLNEKSIERLLISSPIIEICWAYLKRSLSLSLDEGLPLIKAENSAAWRLLRYRHLLSGLWFTKLYQEFPFRCPSR